MAVLETTPPLPAPATPAGPAASPPEAGGGLAAPTTRTRGRGRLRRLGPVGVSLVLHGVALGVALILLAEGPVTPERRLALQATAVAFQEAPPAPETSEVDLLPEDLPVEMDVELPEQLLPPDEATVSDDLPPFEMPARETAPQSEVDIPLESVGTRRPAAAKAPLPVSPAPVPAPQPQARAPAARPRPTPARPVRRGRPLKLVSRPNLMNYYPAEARRRGIEGRAVVEIRVDARGVVIDAVLVTSSGSALLDRQALRVLYDYRFEPGSGGRARVPVNFRLR